METEFTVCGLICNDCDWYTGRNNPKCPGCSEMKGKPFWGTCETYKCVKEKGIPHCGKCDYFPCNDFISRFDPRHGQEEAILRTGLMAYRSHHGDDAAIKLTRKIKQSEQE